MPLFSCADFWQSITNDPEQRNFSIGDPNEDGCLDNYRRNGDAFSMTTSSVPPSSRKPKFDSLEQEAFLNLWRTYDCLKALEEALFTKFHLSAQQYNAMRLLRSVYPESMQTLALGKLLISRSPDTTRMLDRLEQRDLIFRERRSENRRVVEIAITKAGLELLYDMASEVQAMHKQQLGHLSRAEQRELTALLKRIREPHEDASCVWLDE
jgi:DNA-binding MarR family transcriptional regulator